MATKRLVPGSRTRNHSIYFKDGKRLVPEWQQAYLRGQTRVEMTYQEWVNSVVNPSLFKDATQSAMNRIREGHFA